MRRLSIYFIFGLILYVSNSLFANSLNGSYEDVPYYDPKTGTQEAAEPSETEEEKPSDSDDSDSAKSEDDASKEEDKEGDKEGEYSDSKDDEKEKEKCPECHYVVFGDFLWWNARKCHLDYAVNVNESTGVVLGHIHTVHPRWNTGFRVGLTRNCDETEYGVTYTHFCSSTSSHAFKDGTNGVRLNATRLSTGNPGNAFDLYQHAESKYNVDLNLVDFEAGFAPELDEKMKLRVFGGLRLAYLDQKLKSRYTDETDLYDSLKQKIDMDAYGIFIGGGGSKTFCGNFGLWGKAAFGTYVGRFDRTFYQKGLELLEAESETWVDLKDRCYRVVNSIEFALGLEYHLCCKGPCCSDWTVKIGYEFNHFFNTCDFINIIDGSTNLKHQFDRNTDSIGFDGLTVRLVGVF